MAAQSSREDEDFQRIYADLVAEVKSHYPDTESYSPILEPVETASRCFMNLSRSDLLNIQQDADFVAAVYFKLLNRPPSSRDVNVITQRIASGAASRQDELDKVLASQEFKDKRVKVAFK